MTEKKMTRTEFFKAIASNEAVEDIFRNFATEEVEKITEANEKARLRREEKNKDKNEEVNEALDMIFATELKSVIEDEEGNQTTVVTASEAGEILDVSPQKASAILRRGVKLGMVNEVGQVRGAKGRPVKAYARAYRA